MKKRLSLIVTLGWYLILFSQNQTNIWTFGKNAGLDFNSGSPVIFTGSSLNNIEGCTSIADNNGNLLFYTYGDTVWNKNHVMMPNGFGLFGHTSSTQSALIVPGPGNPDIYYIFTTGAQAGFIGGYSGIAYSVVDMSLQSGLGDVTVKNTQLLPNACEKLTAVQHCNGTDFWVFGHEFGTNAFYAFPVTASGVGVPVVTNIGPIMSTGFGNANCLGQMKVSQNGRKLANVTYAFQVQSCILDLDPSTGILSNPVNIPMNGYGVEFSPDGTKVYFAAQKITTTNWRIYQYDLCSSNLLASETVISNNPFADVQSLQLGPDDKIYVARWNSFGQNPYLAVINNPDVAGVGCNYVDNAINFLPQESTFGLPGFVTSCFYRKPKVSWITSCPYDTARFSIACTTDQVDSVRWNFGDPSTGGNNTSLLLNPGHVFSAPGTYSVQVLIHFECRTDTVTNQVTVSPGASVTVSPDVSICTGDSAILSASGNGTFQWSPSAGLNITTGPTVVSTPQNTITYMVIATDSGCVDTGYVTVTVLPAPATTITGNTTLCSGGNTTLTANGASTYVWSTGATTASLVLAPTSTTTYTVTGSNGACTNTATVTVTVNQTPVAGISGDTSVCVGENSILTASGGGTYTWSTGETTSSISVSPTGNTSYSVIVANGACADTAAVNVTAMPSPSANAGADVTISISSSTQLSASGGGSYLWNPSTGLSCTTCPNPVASPTSTTTYYLTVTSPNGCTDVDTVTVFVTSTCDASEGDVFVADAFSPNSDGVNDVLHVKGGGIKTIYFAVYDRWGAKVFETTDQNEGWTGMYKGNELNPGVYVYILKAECYLGEEFLFKGNITLLR